MDDQNTTNQDAMPPKQSPFKTVTAGGAPAAASGDAPKTIVLRRPTLRRPGDAPAAPAVPTAPTAPAAVPAEPPKATPIPARPLSATAQVAQGIAIPHGEAVKKMTSRISVSSATAPIPSATSLIAPVDGAVKPEAATQAAKKMTSRITLESALGTQPDISAAQPKTIRLKRPSEAITPVTPTATPVVAPAVPPAPASLPEGMTPISEAAPAAEADAAEESPTRRKTIKVKRPTGGASGPKISLATTGTPSVDGVASADDNLQSLSGFSAGTAKSGSGPDKVNPFFIVAACLAIIAGSLLVWTLTSQTYGSRGAAGDFAFPKGPVIPPPPGLTVVD